MNNYGIPLTADESEIDMGSFVLTKKDSNMYEFQGLSKDISKLPTVKAIGTGSVALCVDTGDVLMYEKTTRNWNQL